MAKTHYFRTFWLGLCGAALLALAACGESGTQTSASKASADAPGIVVFNRGNAAEPATVDPHLAQANWEDHIIGDMLMGLTTEDAKGEPIPGAAERWETSPDGLTWTFHIRDHQWSDGQPVTAGDFVFAWRRILDPKTAASYAYYLYLIKNAQAVNTGKMPATAMAPRLAVHPHRGPASATTVRSRRRSRPALRPAVGRSQWNVPVLPLGEFLA